MATSLELVDRVIAEYDAAHPPECPVDKRRRCLDWHQRELAANHFVAEYGHADDAAAPHPVQDRLE